MYAAAQINRLNSDWDTYPTSHDQEIRFSLPNLRSRSRQLMRDEAIAKRYMNMVLMNVVGPDGFNLQMKVTNPDGTPDKLANDKIEEAWKLWCEKKNCTVAGDLTFRDVCNTILTHAVRDGEFLARSIARKSATFGFQMQLLQPEFLNHLVNRTEDSGNITRMGVEFNSWRKPVAYHLTKIDPALEVYANYQFSRDTERINAAEIYHGFMRDHAFQSRGIPWLAPVMIRMRDCDKWEEAALWNARASAGKMGFVETDVNAPDTKYEGDDVDQQGNVIDSVEPGRIEQLARGQKFVGYAPQYPEAQHEMFVKAMRRAIASGLNVSYNALANDLEGVNFSSIRAGLLDERENWKSIQRWFIDNFLKPIFTDWLDYALLSGDLYLPNIKFEKFNKPLFIGRRWAWVDPLKDITAKILEISSGLNDPFTSSDEMGKDYEETLNSIKQAIDLAKGLGLEINLADLKLTPTKAGEDTTVSDTANPPDTGPTDQQKNELEILAAVRQILSVKKSNGHLKEAA